MRQGVTLDALCGIWKMVRIMFVFRVHNCANFVGFSRTVLFSLIPLLVPWGNIDVLVAISILFQSTFMSSIEWYFIFDLHLRSNLYGLLKDKLLGTRSFILFSRLEALTLKALLLLELVSGRWIGELHSWIRKGLIAFGEHYNWVRLHPNPQFLSEEWTASFRRGPILTSEFKTNVTTHYVICPVYAIRSFLNCL